MKHHLPNGRFRNNAELELTHTRLADFFKWKSASPKVERIAFPISKQVVNPKDKREPQNAVTWIGHATFLIEYAGLNILTDPHFSKRASPVQWAGPARTTQPALSIEDLPHIDVVVVSHDHYDHLDLNSVRALKQKQASKPPMYMVPLKVGRWLSRQGIKDWIELDWWQSTKHLGWQFTSVPVQHFSGRGAIQNNTLWAGWVLEAPESSPYRLLFVGDSGYSSDFKEIGRRFAPFDLSLIPIGAYEPRWFMREVHVNPEEAVRIHLDVGSKKSIAMHWGSFILTDEPMDQPPLHLQQAKQKLNVEDSEFVVVDHGARIPIHGESND